MNQFSYKPFYRRYLPHIQPEGATFFVTFRLAGSLPAEILEKLCEEQEQIDHTLAQFTDPKERDQYANLSSRRLFGKLDTYLDQALTGVKHLANEKIAEMVFQSILYRDGKVYDLEACCLMPNHAHLVFKPLENADGHFYSLATIMHSLKRHTARQANLLLKREGSFWQHESYDHFARNQAELERIIQYVVYIPIKAGLVSNWQDWKWTYSKYDSDAKSRCLPNQKRLKSQRWLQKACETILHETPKRRRKRILGSSLLVLDCFLPHFCLKPGLQVALNTPDVGYGGRTDQHAGYSEFTSHG